MRMMKYSALTAMVLCGFWICSGCSSDDLTTPVLGATDGSGAGDSRNDGDITVGVDLAGVPTGVALDEPCQSAATCDDKNECTEDTCVLSLQLCQHVAAAEGNLTCDDHNDCTVGDTCIGIKCSPGKAKICEDGNSCTEDTCAPAGGCSSKARQGGVPCKDSNECTDKDTCTDGTCKGVAKDCNDNNSCTKDACDQLKGCTHVIPEKASCDDGKPCTTEECILGECAISPLGCSDNNPCTNDTCKPEFGGCVSENSGSTTDPCSDNNPCTENDKCNGNGSCAPGPAKKCLNDDCTNNACDPGNGVCVNNKKPGVTTCDDGNKCTQNDVCGVNQAGAWGCVGGKLLPCDDGNPCTYDNCTQTGGCAHTANNAACEDGNVCTFGDTCVQESCQPGKIQKCDDGNVCTTDSCTTLKGCTYTANSGSCDDQDACTSKSICANTVCSSVLLECDDKNPCTKDSCAQDKGCQSKPLSKNAQCNDANPCTLNEVCDGAGKCLGVNKDCADDNPCTLNSCDVKTGNCNTVPSLNGVPCTDGNACTSGDACKGGVCVGPVINLCEDPTPCTVDSCDPISGKCSHTPDKPGCK